MRDYTRPGTPLQPVPGGADGLEIFSIDIGADNSRKRLTSNQVTDTHPDGVPCGKRLCTRCAEVGRLPSVGPSPQVVSNGVVVRAAVLPDGNPSTVSVEDYSAPRDGVNEIMIGWSQANGGTRGTPPSCSPRRRSGTARRKSS